MPEKLSTRVERLEESEKRASAAIEAVADRQAALDNALAMMADSDDTAGGGPNQD